MKQIRIWIENFWPELPIYDNIFVWILKKKYDVVFDDIHPEYVFTGYYSGKYQNSTIISYNAEPDTSKSTSHYHLFQYYTYEDPNNLGENHIRFPHYLHYAYEFMRTGDIKSFDFFYEKRRFEKKDLEKRTNFCAFIHRGDSSTNNMLYRDKISLKISSEYKKIDFIGSRFNNGFKLKNGIHGYDDSKIKRDYLKKYKFAFGFESQTTRNGYEGYTTEKILDPLVAGTLPLYWGNKLIYKEFNNKSFLNYYDFENEEEFIEKLIEIDNNDDLYMSYMRNSICVDNKYLNIDYLVYIMDKIIK